MTGDSHTNDDSDFLEDDFVVEDIVGKNDDLEDLFEAPAPSKADSEGKKKNPSEEPAEDDLLFSDHTEGLVPTEEFVKPSFAEDAATEWDGGELDLEAVGVPGSSLDGEADAADPEIAEAAKSFVEELDSLLNEEDDFAIESEADLELVEMDSADEDGISEFEQSGPFVLDDGDGLWSEDLEESGSDEDVTLEEQPASPAPMFEEDVEPAAAEHEEPEMTLMSAGDQLVADSFAEGETVASMDLSGDEATGDEFEDVDNLQLLDTAAGGMDGPGWEPLPARSMDGLSEVDEVQRTDDEYDTEGYEDDDSDAAGYEDEAYEDGEYEGADGDLEDVEGHDIYGENEDSDRAVVLGGPGSQRRRTRTLLLSMAASILFLVGVSTIVVRPQWFGLSVEPEQVAKIDLTRPKVEVAVVEPRLVPLASTQPDTNGAENTAQPVEGTPDGVNNPDGVDPNNPTSAGTGAQPTGTDPNGTDPNGTDPNGAHPNVTQPSEGDPGVTPTDVKPTQPAEVMANGGEQPELPTLPGQAAVVKPAGQPIAVTPVSGENTEPGGGENAWPIASTKPAVKPEGDKPALVPFGNGLLVGGATGMKAARALEGVMPGSRAFAQLHNGNYFIGKVKQVADETITLRLETGEVTLATVEIAQLTRLGSTDYDELQKATKGFVRLTNNNRLIGGILSKIADDHIILEFRSNRVMLPKSAVGEIVSGKEEDSNVRLGTTNEEDNWVRGLAERQLGSGNGVAPNKKPKAPASSEPPR